MMTTDWDVIVLGGGAAGMFAAIQAGYAGAKVLLLEPNERLGKKLYITGKGRCNLTNACSWQEVLKNVPRNPRFLYSAMSGFSPEDAVTFFESHGCETKTERGNRVFPVSDRAASVIDALKTALGYAGVELRRARGLELLTKAGRICGVRTDRGVFEAPAVILATGGKSYPATGSTGDGYRLAKDVGHSIVPPVGSLVPMVEDGPFCARMQGLALKNVNVRLYEGPCHSEPSEESVPPAPSPKPVYEEFGELLFTHFGLSGPVILSASAHMEQGKRYLVSIDLKPALDEATLDARILRDFGDSKNRSFENAISGLYPKTMIPVIVARSGIPGDTKVNAVTKEQRRALLTLTKHFTVQISGLRPVEEAIVTSGGVSVKEIDPKTMASKLVGGLYFAGEVMDVDAYTGGFNLQIAWATAYAAGTAAAGSREA
ncbi:MAG: NAD(P)/FAD-dependent oxidoreductase [Oscillospiraceae bacterium]|nr:NAD(P)/FAD-dependent oxidoreductase [Oscillospiraceae bacterium]